MAIKLKSTETVKAEAHFHWSSYLAAGTWAAACTPGTIAFFIALFSEERKVSFGLFFMTFCIAYLPITIRFLSNKCKHYVITNERVFVEEGIFAKTKKDIPLQKINDLEVSQGVIQRMFGSGNLCVLTGNDKPTRLINIEEPEWFKNALSEAVSVVSKKAS